MKVHPVIHLLRTTLYVKQPEGISPAVAKRPNLVPTTEGNWHVVDRIMSYRDRRREYHFATLMNGNPLLDSVRQAITDLLDNNGTVTAIRQTYIKDRGIIPDYQSP